MLRQFLINVASIVGIILIALGIIALIYFVSPIRFMLAAFVPHKPNLTTPILGGLALVSGIVLVYVARTLNQSSMK
ncbi:MAG: hypothetical protein WBF06_04745 [Candidatus Acidiferrales bacterium]